jgi:hypothetical protein
MTLNGFRFFDDRVIVPACALAFIAKGGIYPAPIENTTIATITIPYIFNSEL